ncbi:MAG: hypothetical protein JNL70_01090 [Saprospiraceae bacterium]|nr:hypothetical protein [Saprospiraceae bacterium]
MKKLFLLLFLLSELLCSLTAQSFTFSDTYPVPVNNPDSLEAWLTAHPAPSVESSKI